MALWLLGSCSKCALQQYICLSDCLANTSTVYDSSPFFAILALIGMAIALKIPQEEEGKERASLGGETSTRSDFIEESTEPLIAAAEIDQHTL